MFCLSEVRAQRRLDSLCVCSFFWLCLGLDCDSTISLKIVIGSNLTCGRPWNNFLSPLPQEDSRGRPTICVPASRSFKINSIPEDLSGLGFENMISHLIPLIDYPKFFNTGGQRRSMGLWVAKHHPWDMYSAGFRLPWAELHGGFIACFISCS